MFSYWDVTIKLALGLLTIILQINLSGKSNLAPISALDQVQNSVLGAIVGGMIYSTSVTVLQYPGMSTQVQQPWSQAVS